MKKIQKFIIAIVLCCAMLQTTAFADGGTINTVEIKNADGNISISGTTSNVLACAICIYDKTGTTLKCIGSCQVKSDNTYEYTFENSLAAGKYMIAVADYNGGKTLSKVVEIESKVEETTTTKEQASQETNNEKVTTKNSSKDAVATGDNSNYFVIFAVMFVCTVGVIITKKHSLE